MNLPVVVARHRTDCPFCADELIYPGDLIVRHGSQWGHERCVVREIEIDELLASRREQTPEPSNA